MPAYLTVTDAQNRLSTRFDIPATLLAGDVDAASYELDSRGPFVGAKYLTAQTLQFPRSVTIPGDTAGVVPERILDWVALRAFQLSTQDTPGVLGEGVSDDRVRYARPKRSRAERLMRSLLSPYRRGGARIV